MSGQEAGLQQYRQEQDLAYRRLGHQVIRSGQPIRTMGELFPDVALTEAQSGQTPGHVFALMALRLVGTGEATWQQLATATLDAKIARRMAVKADELHERFSIVVPEIAGKHKEERLEFLAKNTSDVFGHFMEHAFHTIVVLSPEGAAEFGARIDYNQGIAHPITGNGPKLRNETLPYIERYLADPTTFENVYHLYVATTAAILGPGREFKDAFLARLAEIGKEHAGDELGDRERRDEKLRKDMQARVDLWRATHELIRNAIDNVEGFSNNQKDDFAWNSSMVFVNPRTDLIPPAPDA